MPLFEYECPRCHRVIEVVEPFESYGAPRCSCKVDMVRREFSVPARTRVGKYGKAGGLPPERE